MPFTLTAAKSSRVSKSHSGVSTLRRSSSSPFSQSPKRKAISRSSSKQETAPGQHDADRLKSIGLVTCLAAPGQPQDVARLLEYIKTQMFDEIPERAGMNSVRIAELLNFRRILPPMVSKSHVHTLVFAPTRAERDIASLAAQGRLKKITVQGRSIAASNAYEALVLIHDWVECINLVQLEPSLNEKYVQYLKGEASGVSFTREETIFLFKAGFLTSAFSASNSTSIYDNTSSTTMTSIASISKAASGSVAAVGGSGAFHGAGGGTGGLQAASKKEEFRPSLPNTGAFLKLLDGATQHLMHLLSKSNYSEAPMSLLRERWNGGVAADGTVRKATGYNKDPFAEVLPGRTKKWKQFYGLKFEWVLAECLGAGLVEVFETGTVGKGVRTL